MSRSSTATSRARPLVNVSTAAGAFQVHSETFTIETTRRIEIIDLTDRVMSLVRGLHVREGLASVFSMHTTCSVYINEFQPALVADMTSFLEQVADRDAGWLHNNPSHSDCDRLNADSHLRAMLLGHSLTLQVSAGDVVLGGWQRVLLAELDGPRVRTLRLSVMGVS